MVAIGDDEYDCLLNEHELLVLHRRHMLAAKTAAWVEERWQDCVRYKHEVDRIDRSMHDLFLRMTRLRIMKGVA